MSRNKSIELLYGVPNYVSAVVLVAVAVAVSGSLAEWGRDGGQSPVALESSVQALPAAAAPDRSPRVAVNAEGVQ